MAAALIIGESWRSSRSQAKRRDVVDDRIEDLVGRVNDLEHSVKNIEAKFDERWAQEKERYVHERSLCLMYTNWQMISNDELTRILNRVVDVGIRGGWSQLDDTPLREAKVRVQSEETPPTENPQPHSEQFLSSDTS